MTVQEAIDLFYNEMYTAISDSPADETLREILIDSLKDVKQLVTDTSKASSKH